MSYIQRRWWMGALVLAAGIAIGMLVGAPQREAQAQINTGPTLTGQDVTNLLNRAQNFAQTLDSAFRGHGGNTRRVRMQIAVVARDGRLLQTLTMPDAWTGAYDLAVGEARTAAFFSSNENAITSRALGRLSQAHDPDTGDGPAGPFWGIWAALQPGTTGLGAGSVGAPSARSGVVVTPGGVPLYKTGVLVGAIGVAGDGTSQNEAVAFRAAFLNPPPSGIVTLGF